MLSGILTFTLPLISGNFTRIAIKICYGEDCEPLYQVAADAYTRSPSEITQEVQDAEAFSYKLSVYQHNDEVVTKQFSVQSERKLYIFSVCRYCLHGIWVGHNQRVVIG